MMCEYSKCENTLTHTKGRRKKKYCSPSCKQKGWQEQKSDKMFVKVPIEEYNLLKGVGNNVEKPISTPKKPLNAPQKAEIKAVALKEEKEALNEPKNTKKEMPNGLSRTEQMKWMRENQ